nr:hypothetical protein [Tanacetum cinerariifolium]
DLVFKALDKSQMGEDCSMSSNKSVSKLVSLEPIKSKYGCLIGFFRRHYRIGSDSSHRALCSIYSEGPSCRFLRPNFSGFVHCLVSWIGRCYELVVIDKHYVELMVVGELLDANNVGNEKVLHKIVNVVKRNNVVEQVVITVVDSE